MRDTVSDMGHSATLLVGIAAFAADPTGLTLGGALASGTLSLKELFKPGNPAARQLAKDIAADLKTGLTAPTFHMPADGPRLLPQMIEKALPDPAEIVGQNLNPDALLGVMLNKLTDPDHRRADMAEAFCNLLRPSLMRLLRDRTFTDSLAPAIARETLDRLSHLATQVAVLTDQFRDTARQLGMTEQFIISLAQNIAPEVEDLATAQRELRRAIDTAAQMNAQARLPSNVSDQVTAVMAAMKERNDLGDLDGAAAEVDRALDEEKNAYEARRMRLLDIALEQDILRRNAPSAAGRIRDRLAIDLSGQALWDGLYQESDQLRREGLRFGRPFDQDIALALSDIVIASAATDVMRATALNLKGVISEERGKNAPGTDLLAQAVAAFRDALTVFGCADHRVQWATTIQNLANALAIQGTRTAGAEGTDLLAQAIAAYGEALTVCTCADHPVDWAKTMQNLAVALMNQGTRTAGAAGTALLAQAVAAYREALTVRTRADHPVNWALTMQNLANVLGEQGTRTAGGEGTALLAEAVAAFREALTVYTRADHPVDWAMTTQNLANALQIQGTSTAGAEGIALLAQAVSAYREALTVRTRADHPVQWAETTQNLAIALRNQGSRTAGAEGTALLAEAIAAYREALTVTTRADHPVDWAMTQENLAIAEEARADHPATDDAEPHLQAALAHVEAALEVYDPEHMPYDHGTATRLRDDLRARLA